ncbi:hypothetical protein AX774_g2249 [Zancudomyces culisetae]|uniref:ShKT domain-containing protein n=1 Tax=Zancudomyces culisetae TaxID=1213189 RepID=A0A1R1PTD8_ZANCU|nr:hypothetical protein AX774_g2249 [Zancudomyces culisetae]|eukprot:OMH84230.1 hypothetical protein AX774_g2249 [Zancudomyces culisetae]
MKAFTLSLLTLALNALSVSASSQSAQSNEYQNSVHQNDNQIYESGNEGIAFNQNENINNSNGDWIQNLGDLTYAENNGEYSNESCDGALGNDLAAGKRRGSRRVRRCKRKFRKCLFRVARRRCMIKCERKCSDFEGPEYEKCTSECQVKCRKMTAKKFWKRTRPLRCFKACKKCSKCLESKKARVNKLFSDPVFDDLKKAFSNLKTRGTLESYKELRKAIKESTPPAAATPAPAPAAAPAAAAAPVAAPKPTAGGK